MHTNLYEQLQKDVRIVEGLHACMNCGICTSVCPAAEFFDYDPRSVAVAVQSGNEKTLTELLESDIIWFCGQCMSCKPRCPRNNCPGMIISVLRKLSQETGSFIKSRYGRQQYLILKTTGANIFKFGYCVHPTSVVPQTHPEQGPVWNWIYENMNEVYAAIGANLDGEGEGAMRAIAAEDLSELYKIFEVSGGTELHQIIEAYSTQKALELGFCDADGKADMQKYAEYIFNNENQ